MIRFTFYNVLQLPSDLIDFTFIKEVIYDDVELSVTLVYSDGQELNLGTVDPGQAKNVVGATINSEGELIFSFDDGNTINVGYVLSEHEINVIYDSGLGLLVSDDGTYVDLKATGSDITIYEGDDNFVIDAVLPEIEEDKDALNYIQRPSFYANIFDNNRPSSSTTNQWEIRPITRIGSNNIGISLNPDGSFELPSGYYYISAVSVARGTYTGKMAIRDVTRNINHHESVILTMHRNSYDGDFKTNGYIYLDEASTLAICHYFSSGSAVYGATGLSQHSNVKVDIWRVSDDDQLEGLIRYQDIITTHPVKLLEGRERFVISGESDTSDIGLQPHRTIHKDLVLSNVNQGFTEYEINYNVTKAKSDPSITSNTASQFHVAEGRYYAEISLQCDSNNGILVNIIDDDRNILFREQTSAGSNHKVSGMFLALNDTNLDFIIAGVDGSTFSIYADDKDVISSIKLWNISNIIDPDQEWNKSFDVVDVVSGTPSLPNTGRGVYADTQYVYLAHAGGNFFTVVDKSDWSVVSGTPSLASTGYGVHADDQYVYLAHNNGNRFTVVDKSDWSIVSGTPSFTSAVYGVYADDQYVYLAHFSDRRFTVVDKSDWTVVSGTPSLPSTGWGVYADDQYVYLAHANGNRFTVVDKSDWSVVSGTPSLPGDGQGVHADDQYVYLAHFSGNHFTVVDKSDWSVVSGTLSLPGTGRGVYADEQYVYLAHNNGNCFTVVDKSDWSVVSGTPSLPSTGWGVHADDQYVYLAHVGGRRFTVIEKKKYL